MIIYKIIILLMSLVLHEIAHGYVAYLCGDKTAKYYGRLSLNPLKHLDPMGTILPIVMLLSGSSFVIGWAKPVPVNYWALKNEKWGEFFVAIAGSAMNFLLMIIVGLLIRFNILTFNPITSYFMVMNMLLGCFNLIPIPPLDGSRVVASFLSLENRIRVFNYDRIGLVIVILLGYTGIISKILMPMFRVVLKVLNFVVGS